MSSIIYEIASADKRSKVLSTCSSSSLTRSLEYTQDETSLCL
jgi:hypothetical protein